MSLARTHRSRRSDDAEVDMTPMLDIVFIMLIFFIVTATFLNEKGLNFTQPPPSLALPIELTPAISIYVDAKDSVSVENVSVELSAVASRVERLIAEKPKAVISLRADAKASLDPVVYIKDQMKLAGRDMVMKIDRPE